MIETPKRRFTGSTNASAFLDLSATALFTQALESAFAQCAYELASEPEPDRSAQLVGARRYMEILSSLAEKTTETHKPTSKNLDWNVK